MTYLHIAATYCIIIALLALLVVYLKVRKINKQKRQLQRYWNVKVGMSEDEMLDIMGGRYNRSLLKDNRVKYEWRMAAVSYSSSYDDVKTRTIYSGEKKVTIYVKNGFVEEVRTHNV